MPISPFGSKYEFWDALRLYDAAEEEGWALPCRSNPDAFFSERRSDEPYNSDDVALALMAKRACLDCPIMMQCREYAVKHREDYGIWGGTTYRERREIWRAKDRRGVDLSVEDARIGLSKKGDKGGNSKNN